MQPVRRPTMHDVARLAGVSIKTVSRVVNDEPAVRSETAERVLSAVAELKFRRNDMARNLRAGNETLSLGLIIGDLSNPFYSAIARGVESVAWQHQSLVISGSSEEDPERERQLVGALSARRVDGLLVVPASPDQSHLRAEIAVGTPIVFIDRRPATPNADSIVLDNEGGVQQGIAHLLNAGHRRIAMLVDSLAIPTMQTRLDGFRAALTKAGRHVHEDLIRVGLHDPEASAAATSELLSRRQPPTAIFACNNRLTLGAVEEIHRRDVDVAVVGFDDFELSQLIPVRLATVSYDAGELGRRAAAQLFRRIAGSRSRPIHDVVATRLVQRGLSSATGG